MLAARGTILMQAKKPDSAITDLDTARAIYEQLSKSSGDQRTSVAACDVKLGEATAAGGNDQKAATHFQQALTVVEPLIKAPEADLDALYVAADAYSGLGDLSAKKAQRQRAGAAGKSGWIAAHTYYQQSFDAWRRIEHPNHTAPNSFEVGDPMIVAKKLKMAEASSLGN
jgi:tetratricopeptide (TPR) repeat protein